MKKMKKYLIMITLIIFFFIDVCLYIATPYEFRMKQKPLTRLVPGSGIYLFIKNKLDN